ncbi:MAG: flippase-like domain-containing protein, partial [Candidatus Latescibacteria bacterium]|nr:flippase-like domain-containing protein [Candidatus Latescibacterota bacterium]
MRKKILINAARYVVLLLILAFGGWYVGKNYDRFAADAHFTVWNVSLIIILNLATILVEASRLRIMIRKLGHRMNLASALRFITITQALNHVVLKAGTFSVGYYMSKKFDFSFHSYVAFVVPYVVVMTLASGVAGLVVTLSYLLAGCAVDMLLPTFFLAVIISCTGFVAIARFSYTPRFMPRILRTVISCWNEIYSDYRLILSLIAVEIVYFTLCSIRFMVAVTMFSANVSILSSVVVLTVGNFLRVAALVPGGLGIAEVASGWTAALLGDDPGISALSAGLDRLVYVAFVMVFG